MLTPLPRARHRIVVRPQVPRAEDVDRRTVRHVRDDGGAPDAAAAVVRARDERRVRQERGRARQRPRPVPARSHHRPVVRGGVPSGHRAKRQRRSRRRGDPARRARAIGAGRAGAASTPVAAAPADHRAARAARRSAPQPTMRSMRRRCRACVAAFRCSLARLQILPTRRLSSRARRTNSRRRRSNRKFARRVDSIASTSAPILPAARRSASGSASRRHSVSHHRRRALSRRDAGVIPIAASIVIMAVVALARRASPAPVRYSCRRGSVRSSR